ncbi:hypothetical protein F4821DRAFT_261617 [Hypoxylon rubiginosum]|uniref:Uncharacterized protein n=1 Tax=Hypoxylon rubiginosum TaxID=110542 RepID=A0ACC0CW50_9PEZI|nr:hypothetical protein F4821DRAFT_261617 [Hypoxylon rubiginosum]
MVSQVELPRTQHPQMGVLKHVERFLGLRQDQVLPADIVFVSLALRLVSSDQQEPRPSTERPAVSQIGFATLDTRDICALSTTSESTSSDLTSMIFVHLYHVETPSSSEAPAQAHDYRPTQQCAFAQPQPITQDRLRATIVQNLSIKDRHTSGQRPRGLRPVVLVGHSISADLQTLRALDMDLPRLAPVVAIIDTHALARSVLPPQHSPYLRLRSFTQAGVLAQLGRCPQRTASSRNAGNGAVYTLYSILLLAVEAAAKSREEKNTERMSAGELEKLSVIKQMTSSIPETKKMKKEKKECSAVAAARGARRLEDGSTRQPVEGWTCLPAPTPAPAPTLGAGLRELIPLPPKRPDCRPRRRSWV